MVRFPGSVWGLDVPESLKCSHTTEECGETDRAGGSLLPERDLEGRCEAGRGTEGRHYWLCEFSLQTLEYRRALISESLGSEGPGLHGAWVRKPIPPELASAGSRAPILPGGEGTQGSNTSVHRSLLQ